MTVPIPPTPTPATWFDPPLTSDPLSKIDAAYKSVKGNRATTYS